MSDNLICPSCQAAVVAGSRFCEACGEALPESEAAPAPAAGTCVNCGADDAVGDDNYCQQCGFKQPDPHDHEETDLDRLAGVTDRGLRHHRNEDAMGLAAPTERSALAVVCDGVSSSANADVAAKAAVGAATPVLIEAAASGGDLVEAMTRAAAAAQKAVLAVHRTETGDAPSCTFVSAVAGQGLAIVAWIGDSRAYWLGAGGNRRLTTDDSWAAEQVAAGTMTDAAAEADERAHSITRWLGADATELVPHTVTFSPDGKGRLLVCSDGLWNYASAADDLAGVLATLAPDASPLVAARRLTDFALDAGGHDNITVVIIAV